MSEEEKKNLNLNLKKSPKGKLSDVVMIVVRAMGRRSRGSMLRRQANEGSGIHHQGEQNSTFSFFGDRVGSLVCWEGKIKAMKKKNWEVFFPPN